MTAPSHRSAKRAEVAQRRAEAVRLAADGMTYQEIADRLGYGSRQGAHQDVQRALAEYRAERDAAAEHLIDISLVRIDEALRVASEVMRARHLAHSGGALVKYVDDAGEEHTLEDSGPRLAAASRFVAFDESRRKLLGLDAPAASKVDLSVDAAPAAVQRLGSALVALFDGVLDDLQLSDDQRSAAGRLLSVRVRELAETLRTTT